MKNIYENLNAIQVSLNAKKDKWNQFGKYYYRSAEGILESLKEHLQRESCVLTLSDEPVVIGDRYYIKATVTLRNAEGEAIVTTAYAREDDKKAGMDAAMLTGSSSSYARKYALNGMFAIDDCKDQDTIEYREQINAAESGEQEAKQEKKAAKQEKKPAAAAAPARQEKPVQPQKQAEPVAPAAPSAPAAPAAPAQDQKPCEFYCDDCGGQVTPFDMNGQTYSPEKIVSGSRKKYGKSLCMECYMKRKQA